MSTGIKRVAFTTISKKKERPSASNRTRKKSSRIGVIQKMIRERLNSGREKVVINKPEKNVSQTALDYLEKLRKTKTTDNALGKTLSIDRNTSNSSIETDLPNSLVGTETYTSVQPQTSSSVSSINLHPKNSSSISYETEKTLEYPKIEPNTKPDIEINIKPKIEPNTESKIYKPVYDILKEVKKPTDERRVSYDRKKTRKRIKVGKLNNENTIGVMIYDNNTRKNIPSNYSSSKMKQILKDRNIMTNSSYPPKNLVKDMYDTMASLGHDVIGRKVII